ncbi:hypothetical protein [Nocardia sienata]|uniref:hypothetical protein n=1 Tax=Nocardia sienata TaxID=248552 RepID=UPI0007A4BC28|nr:hypothetical protein [Nocardia sienata]
MESKTKVAGPLAAAGAVSLGLVLIGACGIGQEDTYVPPPPIRSGPQAAEPAGFTGEPSAGVAKVLIPPSPSWRMAPEPPPRRTLPPEYQISVTASTGPGGAPTAGETTRRVTLSATPDPTAPTEPGWTTASVPGPPVEPAHTESPLPAPPSNTTVVIAPVPPEAENPPPAEPPAAPPSDPPAPPSAEPPAAVDEQGLPETGTADSVPAESTPTQVPVVPRVAVPTTTEPATPDSPETLSLPTPTVTVAPVN